MTRVYHLHSASAKSSEFPTKTMFRMEAVIQMLDKAAAALSVIWMQEFSA